jgi:PAS domain S-box-containing protein
MRESTSRLESFYIDVPALRPGTIGAYLLACVSVAAATALRLAIDPYVEGLQFATFLPAVIITTLISGLVAGLYSVVLSITAIAFFVLPPRFSLYVEEPADLLAILLYSAVMLFNVAIIAGVRFAIERTRDQEALLESREHLRLALDATLLGWWQYDPIRGAVWWDTRLKEMLDIAEDWTDVEEFKRRIHPDDIERVWKAVEAAIDPANPAQYAIEFRQRRADGEVRWIECHALVQFQGDGHERRAVSMVGTAQDITERKQREEERKQQKEKEHLLMREVNHRAKNMLSVVGTIARQTATEKPEDFVERFSERIRALSANQDLLIRNEWRGVEIQDLVRAQLAPFCQPFIGRIGVDGPKLRLNETAAQAIGLALHELATNACKYGSLSTDAGRLHIGWEANRDSFTMYWTEREGPPVAAPKRRGFGATVIETMAERSLDGKVDLEYAPSGLTWRLTCPAANALEACERPRTST